MIVTLLIRKILSMFLMMFFGALLVRLKLLKAEDSRVLSALTIYLVIPCLILSSFQIEYSSELRDGLLLSVGGAVIVNVLLILLAWLVCRFYRLDPVEKNSAIYSNAGNLLIPLISSVLGSEWVIYSCIYMTVQMFLLFSHGKSVLCEERHVDLRGIFRNVNIITMFAGVLMLIFHIKLPPLVKDFCDSVSAMTGPLAMIITGMLIGGMGLRQVFRYRRIWVVCLLRLVVFPLVVLAVLKYGGLAALIPEGKSILLITFLATTTPTASTVTQMAQLYGKDANYATSINVLTTLLCVFTMPVMVMLYQA